MKCFGCSKELQSPKNCLYCEKHFCSDSCVEAHEVTYHRINKAYKNYLNYNQPIPISLPKKSPPKKIKISKFITEGQISPVIRYNSLYEISNFIQVMDKNNKPIILGSGSYGKVFLCINNKNNKKYAIKHMKKDSLKKALKSLSGIYTEINLQSRIFHPNKVRLLYVHESKSYFDLVMEPAINGSLFEYIRKNNYLPEEISFKYFIQVVNAVYFLHENDLIHRDIKPENILLYENDNVKLCDFGWCVGLNGGQRGTFCGTTEYMAPEMVNQKEYSKEIDIWSLGVLLYEMLHGYSPFIPNKPNFNEREVMENIKIHNLKFDAKVSKECKELICHLLDENRKKRYKIEDILDSDFVKKYNKIEITYINYNQSININVNNNSKEKDKNKGKDRDKDKDNFTQIKMPQRKYKIEDYTNKNNDNKINIPNNNKGDDHYKKISSSDLEGINANTNNNNKNQGNIDENLKRGKSVNKLSNTAYNFHPNLKIMDRNNIKIYKKNIINIDNNKHNQNLNYIGTPKKKN